MKTISTVETFTGGLMSATITNTPRANEFFKGSIVAYSNEINKRLGIDVSIGVINKKVALDMALVGRDYFKSDICISLTGNAGPDVIENRPPGLVYIAINNDVFKLLLKGTIAEIRQQAIDFVFYKLEEIYHLKIK